MRTTSHGTYNMHQQKPLSSLQYCFRTQMTKLTYTRDFLLRFADTNHLLPISTNHDLLQELLSLRKDGTATYVRRKDTLATKQNGREPGHPEPEHTTLPLSRQSERQSKSRNPRPRSLVTPIDLVAAVAATPATPDIEELGPGLGTFDKNTRRSSLSMVDGRLLRAHARITQQNQQLQNENTELRREVESMKQKMEGMAQEVAKLRLDALVVQRENLALKKRIAREESEDVVARPRTTTVTTTRVVGFGVGKGKFELP